MIIRKLLVILICALPMLLEANEECMVLSNGSEMKLARYREGILQIEATLFKTLDIRYAGWPSYNKTTKDLYFHALTDTGMGIYKTRYENSFHTPELLMPGRYPVLSPDGNLLAYINEDRVLSIRNNSTGVDKLVGDVISNPSMWGRPIWIDNNKLVHEKTDDSVFVFNNADDSDSKLFSTKLFPLASAMGRTIFSDYTAESLFQYEAGKLKLILKNRFLHFGPGIVLLDDGSGFIYSRQTWSKYLRLSESHTIFYYSFNDGSETKLMDDHGFSGGSLLPCLHRSEE